jgi:hypothetical protein
MSNALASVMIALSVAVIGDGATGSPLTPQSDRTAAMLSQLSPAQRQHSLLYPEFGDGGRTRILDARRSVVRKGTAVGGFPFTRARPLHEILAELVCDSDAVVKGTVIARSSFPTANGSFLFTDYSVRVGRVFRYRSSGLAPPEVIVTRAGGAVVVDGVQVEARTEEFPMLTVGGTYILAGMLVPQTGAIHTTSPTGTFEARDNKLYSLPPQLHASDLDPDGGIAETRAIEEFTTVAKGCGTTSLVPR